MSGVMTPTTRAVGLYRRGRAADARASVRLVSKDDDAVWSMTQESNGAKCKSAMADVADKTVKQLLRDLAKLEAPKSDKQ